ncbi:hypothetical protein CLAIMM_02952, partial [Cladophialophora immunda]
KGVECLTVQMTSWVRLPTRQIHRHDFQMTTAPARKESHSLHPSTSLAHLQLSSSLTHLSLQSVRHAQRQSLVQPRARKRQIKICYLPRRPSSQHVWPREILVFERGWTPAAWRLRLQPTTTTSSATVRRGRDKLRGHVFEL